MDDYDRKFTSLCRDYKYRCQACRKKLRKCFLSMHHIVSRDEGGKSDDENIVLTCKPCHNKIEEAGRSVYGSYSDIAYAFSDRFKPPERREAGSKWQQWVYGGKRNPALG